MDKKELLEKGASALEKAAKSVDESVNKRSVLGEYSPAVMLGALLVLVVAVANNPSGMLVIFAIGVAAALSPKILKAVLAKKAQMDEKKAEKAVSKVEDKK